MKALLAIVKNPLVIGIIGLLALSVVVWFGLDHIKFGADNTTLSYPARMLVIALAIMAWLLNLIRKLWQDKRNNNSMLDAIADAKDTSPAPTVEDSGRSAEELAQLNQRFSDAVRTLRNTRFTSAGKPGKNLYQLPWYIIIGPPGAGKTTALVNSGLSFPLADAQGEGALGGIGGTRNCDWWFTNDAVLIDTAGRYTTQDSHRSEDNNAWQGFLKLLKKHRRRQPINGAIVAASIQDLLLQTPQQRSQHAKAIRKRIEELHQQLGIDFPVYVLFTKGDLVAGFSQYFAPMSQAEREQVWGMTFSEAQGANPAAAFEQEFDLLVQRLDQGMLARIHQERDPEKRALIQNFPIQVGNLKSNISAFINEVFSANNFQDQARLRGIYLSSATQQGTPIDRMMAAVSNSFGFGRQATLQQSSSGKSFFIRRLFTDVIFPEANLVGANTRFESSLRWARRACFALLAVGTAGTLVAWAASITRNNQYMGEVKNLAAQYDATASQLAADSPDEKQVTELLEPLRAASAVYDRDAHPWLSGFGLYDAAVDDAADDLYDSALQNHFLPKLQLSLEGELRAQQDSDDGSLFDTLRVYLMLADSEHRDAATIREWATDHWQENLSADPQTRELMGQYLAQLLALDFTAPRLDGGLVKRSRETIMRRPVPQRLYSQLKSSVSNQPPLSLEGAVGTDTMSVFGVGEDDPRAQIPYLYTKAAYDGLDFGGQSQVIRWYDESRWVMGEQAGENIAAADLDSIGREVKQLYLDDYNNYWKRTLDSFHLARFGNLASASKTLLLLGDPASSPILAMLNLTSQNTQLVVQPELLDKLPGDAAEKIAALAPEKLQPTVVDRDFRVLNELSQSIKGQPPKVNAITASLAQFGTEIGAIAMAPDSKQAALAKSQASFSGSGGSLGQLKLLAASSPAPVSTWIKEATQYSWSATLQGARGELARLWQVEVCDVFKQTLAGRFPFAPAGSEDASIEEFNRFFGHNGVEATFFNTHLASFVDQRSWKLKAANGRTLSIKPETLQQMQRASQIRAAFFPRGSDVAKVEFQLKPVKLDATVRIFELDPGSGQPAFSYSHGPKLSKTLIWNGDRDNRVRIVFEDLNGTRNQQNYEGEWGFFHLLADSNIAQTSRSSTYQLTMQASGRKAIYDLRPAGSNNPFQRGLLSGYQCTGSL